MKLKNIQIIGVHVFSKHQPSTPYPYILADNFAERKTDIAFISDLYGKFNDLKKTLQGKNLNLVKFKSKLSSFKSQLELYKRKFKNNQFS